MDHGLRIDRQWTPGTAAVHTEGRMRRAQLLTHALDPTALRDDEALLSFMPTTVLPFLLRAGRFALMHSG